MEPSEREAVAGLVTTVFGRGPRTERGDPARARPAPRARPHVRRLTTARAWWASAAPTPSTWRCPGAPRCRSSSISDVGVAPTHRRRGIMRSVMTAVLDQAVERERADRRADRQRGDDLPAVRLRRRHPLPAAQRRHPPAAAGRGDEPSLAVAGRRPDRRVAEARTWPTRPRGTPSCPPCWRAPTPASPASSAATPTTGRRWPSTPRRTATAPPPGSSSSTRTRRARPTAPRPTASTGSGRRAAATPSSSRTWRR